MRGGIPFSNAPGVTFEYSNYGFAILGQVVARVSGKSYEDYVREKILLPLGMRASTLEASQVSPDRKAPGYRGGQCWKTSELAMDLSCRADFGPPQRLALCFVSCGLPPRDGWRRPINRSRAKRCSRRPWQPAFALRTQEGTSSFGFHNGRPGRTRIVASGTCRTWRRLRACSLMRVAGMGWVDCDGQFITRLGGCHRQRRRPRTARAATACSRRGKFDREEGCSQWSDGTKRPTHRRRQSLFDET